MLTFNCQSFSELSLEELYEIMVLRQEIFVVEQDCPYLDADGKDAQGWHLMGYDSDQNLLAYARLLPEGVSYAGYTSMGRIATAAAARGTGAGKALMRAGVDWLSQRFPDLPIKISSQCYITRFYESFGFQQVGEEYLEDNIPHIAMIRKAGT